ncbi:MAG: methionine gamma-lyase [Thermomonas sp.]|jgi:methionine-gamma-lyase|uniref:methionine gamma-lyase n=1 Tax=Thermomonas sp. TaxID=1971895 RepID=UPI001EB4E356|nr:methionine gamma-lyase [Thermomonas sp.]MBK6416981.1 methionine gamma-lyase [Thermomonas sp.]MBK6924214.1 methionine gamma-lyase [Thermomonas sp.]MBK9670273.1 methionine gamma-lyase [Thermomonas sp.]
MGMPGFSTTAIHHGYDPRDHHGALVPPVYQSATFTFASAAGGGRCFAGEADGYIYTRIANPTLALLESRLAVLEGGAAAIAFGSGMGAITATLWTLLRPGDEIVVDLTLYGCTFAFLHHGIGEFGVRVTHVDMTDPAAVEAAMAGKPKVVYFESPANPNMRLVDIEAVAAAAHRAGALVVVDNTYCTPYLQRPLALGADVVVHSATKYISGHGDVTAGIAVAADAELAQRIRLQGLKDMTGAVLSPQDAALLMRGLKTLALRMDRHCTNAMAVARLLQAHPAVAKVHYPGLETDPQHGLAKRQMRQPGGMIAFELQGGYEAGMRFIDALGMVACAVSLGDAESLAQHPASMTHSTYTPEQREAAGISDGLVRLSAGLEDTDDLVADVARALSACAAPKLRAIVAA